MNSTKALFLLLASLLAGLLQSGRPGTEPAAANPLHPLVSAVASVGTPAAAPAASAVGVDRSASNQRDSKPGRDEPARPADRSKFAANVHGDHALGASRVVNGRGVERDRHF